MSGTLNLVSAFRTGMIAVVLLACSCEILAQRGPGSTGGGSAGGGGLSGGGRATGLSVKDDLKDYHMALALQANSEQAVAYDSMMKATDAADTEVRAFTQQAAKPTSHEDNGPGTPVHSSPVDQAIEVALNSNKRFLDALSPPQKSGLKDILKQMTKADSDLAQQIKTFDLEVRDTKLVGAPIAASAQRLATVLSSFRSRELELGGEMSIGSSSGSQESFDIPPVRTSAKTADQSIAFTTSGTIAKSPSDISKNIFTVQLTTDLSDLQRAMTDVLRRQLDKSETCGERISVQSASLAPRLQQSVATVQFHYERWSCRGRDNVSEIVDGNGTIEIKLTPSVAENAQLRLAAEIGRVDAAGLLGDMLRSGSLGETLRDQLSDVVLSALREGADFKAMLPSAARQGAALQNAHFQSTGSGRLFLALDGTLQLSSNDVTALTTELKGRATSVPTVPR